jgi:hypothetical protein
VNNVQDSLLEPTTPSTIPMDPSDTESESECEVRWLRLRYPCQNLQSGVKN